ncbi:tRNA-specific adenosine deaminase subunit tad3 [Coelomomyces lativittatus]|nr:tRNA-specific adenosine deaminase subunit tad3 [Coelomomyces lativittatus]KAJ1516765.1 tRNA-specific adenosine deaminase subunit tad3 [Coelomomyces lativittatus]KAJ1518553.1 tRNA-specific adenosine deaminase subunit tad3 [Coelomomyces lativittatus]
MTYLKMERVLTRAESRDLETINVWVAATTPDMADCVLNAISTPFPLKEFNHLKRIRKQVKENAEIVLLIILARLDKVSEEELLKLLRQHQLDHLPLKITAVPKWPAITRSQYDAWSPLWPMHWRKSALNLPTHSTDMYPNLMQNLLSYYEQKKKEGFKPISVGLVWDPECQRILTHAMDLSRPLHHVSMSLIEQMTHLKLPIYLCTGLTVVLIHEPCIMCSMALVHARVQTVVYAFPHPNGGLKSLCSVHDEPWLNHHFHVYRYCELELVKHVFNEPIEERHY